MGPLKECKKQKKKQQRNKLAILGHSRVNPTVQRHAPKATDSHNYKAVCTANPRCRAHRRAFNEETRGICMNPAYGAVRLTLGSTLYKNTLVHLTVCSRSPLHGCEWWSGGCAVEGETLSECGTINRKTEGRDVSVDTGCSASCKLAIHSEQDATLLAHTVWLPNALSNV